MPKVFAIANSTVAAREALGAILIPVFEGTQDECQTYTQTHNTDETTPVPGWSPVSDGSLEIRV